jgi:hypothetical protein
VTIPLISNARQTKIAMVVLTTDYAVLRLLNVLPVTTQLYKERSLFLILSLMVPTISVEVLFAGNGQFPPDPVMMFSEFVPTLSTVVMTYPMWLILNQLFSISPFLENIPLP